MSRPKQSLLVLTDDETNLEAIAVALRAVPGVKEVRAGTFHREKIGDVFVAAPTESPR